MLTIYYPGDNLPENLDFINDVEREFAKYDLKDDEFTRNVLKYLEQAEYCDERSFIDRFGYKLEISCLSTGCKAILLVSYAADKIINLIECGLNAYDALVNYCMEGYVLAYNYDMIYEVLVENVSVSVDGIIFDKIEKLNEYIIR